MFRVTLAALVLALPITAPAQDCAPGYRRAQKHDALIVTAPVRATIGDLLHWDTLTFDRGDRCAARHPIEKGVYEITGYVRRIRAEADSDWHVELTASRTDSIGACVVVEIPAGRNFLKARRVLAQLAQIPLAFSGTIDNRPTYPITFTGPAFFDGEHRSKDRLHGVGHGRCNATLWELHPVYSVR